MTNLISIAFLMASMALAQAPARQGETTYSDPQHRFTVTVPPGWTTRPEKDSFVIERGDGIFMISFDSSVNSSPNMVLSGYQNVIEKSWTQFRQLDRGQTMVSGRPAAYLLGVGDQPNSGETMLRLIVGQCPRGVYALFISAPIRQYGRLQETFGQIERSLALTGNDSLPPIKLASSPKSGDSICRHPQKMFSVPIPAR